MNAEKQSKVWGQLIAKCWSDETFKKRLLDHPEAAKEHGLEVPTGIQVKIVEDSDKVVHLTLPAKSSTDELSDDELENVAGGTAQIRGFRPSRPHYHCSDREGAPTVPPLIDRSRNTDQWLYCWRLTGL